jgi:Na+-transporting methylmalonyl-CoA/oxaloacetate decarboxylase gamma subunit
MFINLLAVLGVGFVFVVVVLCLGAMISKINDGK